MLICFCSKLAIVSETFEAINPYLVEKELQLESSSLLPQYPWGDLFLKPATMGGEYFDPQCPIWAFLSNQKIMQLVPTILLRKFFFSYLAV